MPKKLSKTQFVARRPLVTNTQPWLKEILEKPPEKGKRVGIMGEPVKAGDLLRLDSDGIFRRAG